MGYFKALLISEIQRVFPFASEIRNKLAQKCLWLVLAIVISPVFFYKRIRFIIPYAELVLTERCNLRCADCANLMPLYKNPGNVELETLLSSLKSVLEVSGGIDELTLLGGEPLLYPRLSDIISFAAENKKIKRLKIITNGTFVPAKAVLDTFKKYKIKISISEYRPEACVALTGLLEREGIEFELRRFENWNDYGGAEKRDLNEKELCRSYTSCASAKCKTIRRGILYPCPRAAHLTGLGIIEEKAFVDLQNIPLEGRKKHIKDFYKIPYAVACDYCNPIWNRPSIQAGKQL